MMDLSKVADLALIMIDASIGLEMETFEFISLLNVINMYFYSIRIMDFLMLWVFLLILTTLKIINN